MGKIRWRKNAAKREVERYNEGIIQFSLALNTFGKFLDDLTAQWKASTPEQREILRKKLLSDVGQN